MNKYSKRALKTTATVGMSLAMVLSAAAPVMAAGLADKTGPYDLCEVNGTACRSLYFDLATALKDVDFEEVTLDSGEVVKVGTNEYNALRTVGNYAENLKKYAATGTLEEYSNVKKWTDITDKIDAMFEGVFATVADIDISAYTTSTIATWSDALQLGYVATGGDTGKWVDMPKASTSDINDAKAALTQMGKWETASNHLSSDLKEVFDDVKAALEAELEDYLTPDAQLMAEFVEVWTKILDKDLDGPKNTAITLDGREQEVTGYSTGTSTIDLTKKSEIQNRIKAIKDAPDYSRFKNEEVVTDLIESYENLLDNLTDLKDLLTSDSYKAYGKTKTDDENKTVKDFLAGANFGADGETRYDASSLIKSAKDVAKYLDSEQFEILKAVKEDVLDVAYKFETKKIGNYYVDKSGFADGITSVQQGTINRDIPSFMLKVVDNETGEFGYDYVAKHMEALNEALAAVTTEIEKITPANIKASDKAKLVAAEDALYELTATKGKYSNNLTDKEARAIRTADKKIENLRLAFDNLGTTDAPGWVDMGNGNWNYNNEDGTPAAYKWVAAGSDWYFVRDGKMARNTWLAANSTDWYYLGSDGKMATSVSVDGCWINSLGIYKK